jgi:hypothetical protein
VASFDGGDLSAFMLKSSQSHLVDKATSAIFSFAVTDRVTMNDEIVGGLRKAGPGGVRGKEIRPGGARRGDATAR